MNEFKHACQFCGGHIAYDQQYAGRTIQCPHCGKEITLGSAGLSTQPHAQSVDATRVTDAHSAARRFISPAKVAALTLSLLLVAALGVLGLRIATKHNNERQRRATEELARTKAEADRIKAEAEEAKAEAEMAKLKADQEKKARVAAKAAADAEAFAAAEAVKRQVEAKARLEEEQKSRVKKNPSVWALWEEQDHDAIRIVSTRANDVAVNYKGASLTAKYEDIPEWLRIAAQTKHKEDGEAKGLIRELDGKIYDLRSSPPGWATLPTAEVIQIVEDGYLMIDVAFLQDRLRAKVFKLKHNGLVRILNTGDRFQVTAMSVGTYTYENKNYEMRTVPVYDAGMPVGPLRDKIVTMSGKPAAVVKHAKPSSDEPSGNGSGFFITEDGLFITNAHVVEDSTRIEVKTAAGRKRAAVLRIDKDKDLALLRVSLVKGSVPALNVATNSMPLGAQVFTIGYPLVEFQGSRPKFTDGKISSVAGIRDDPDQMQISVAVQPGNSGGPLADMNGDIVGVVVARLNDLKIMALAGSIPQNVNYAVKGTTLVRFLNENKAIAPGANFGSSPQRTQEEAIRAVEKASGLVLVYE
jgi:S1-C subfamily serine protease